jgi:lipoprotein NlpD
VVNTDFRLINAFALILGLAWIVAGCTGSPVVPVSDLTNARTKHAARIVRAGDSLYTIAWTAGLDYRDVARWNKLQTPYALQVGQKIYLGGEVPGTEISTSQVVSGLQAKRPVSANNPPAVVRATSSESSAGQTAPPASGKTPDSAEGWVWPAGGDLITRFNDAAGENGIDIAGVDGSPIRAAANGKVVYAGTGLRGYGLLLIIKHDETFLSAYAHNRAVTVNEGDEIYSGQVIAEMGQSGASSVRLHFEIRRNGQPIDPLTILPSR